MKRSIDNTTVDGITALQNVQPVKKAKKKVVKPLLEVKAELRSAYERYPFKEHLPSTVPYGPRPTFPISYAGECDDLYEDVLALIGNYLDPPSRNDASLVSKLWNSSMNKIGQFKTLHSSLVNILSLTRTNLSDKTLLAVKGKTFLVVDVGEEEPFQDSERPRYLMPVSLRDLSKEDVSVIYMYIEYSESERMDRSGLSISDLPSYLGVYKKCASEPVPPIRLVVRDIEAWDRRYYHRDKCFLSLQIHPIVFSRLRHEMRPLLPAFVSKSMEHKYHFPGLPNEWYPSYKPPHTPVLQPTSNTQTSYTLHDYQNDGVSWMLSVEEAVHNGQKVHTPFIVPFREDGDPRLAVKLVIEKGRGDAAKINYERSYFVDSRECEDDMTIAFQGGILADYVGMGKSIQLLSLIESSRLSKAFYKFTTAPTLIVCPEHILYQWESELKKFYPSLLYSLLYDQESHEKLSKEGISGFHVVIMADTFYRSPYFSNLMLRDKKNPKECLKVTMTPDILEAERVASLSSGDVTSTIPGGGMLMPSQITWRRIIIDEAPIVMRGVRSRYFLSLKANTYWWVSATTGFDYDLMLNFLRINSSYDCLRTDIVTINAETGEEMLKWPKRIAWPRYVKSDTDRRIIERLMSLRTFYSVTRELTRRGNIVKVPRMTIRRIFSYGDMFKDLKAIDNLVQNSFDCIRQHGSLRLYDEAEEGFPGIKVDSNSLNQLSPFQRTVYGAFYDLKRALDLYGTLQRMLASTERFDPNVQSIRVNLEAFGNEKVLDFVAGILTYDLHIRVLTDASPRCAIISDRSKISSYIDFLDEKMQQMRVIFQSKVNIRIPTFMEHLYPKSPSLENPTEEDLTQAIRNVYGDVMTVKIMLLLTVHRTKDNKILVFAYSSGILGMVEEVLETLGIEFGYAGSPRENLGDIYHNFNRKGSNVRILLINRNVDATGITVNSATHMIFLDGNDRYEEKKYGPASSYHYGVHERNNYMQCLGRAHRYGQENSVEVIHFEYKDLGFRYR